MGIRKEGKIMYYLPYTQFVSLFADALEVTDYDMYIGERGWQEWMNDFDLDTIVKTLDLVRDISVKSFQELRKETGLSQVRMASAYGITRRTIENWESGIRVPPDHDRLLLSYVIFLEMMNRVETSDGEGEDDDITE